MKSALRASATAVSDFAWLSRGDSVFIKTALNSSYPYPSTTNPVAVAAMIELLKDKGAGSVIVGDMSGIEHVKLSAEGTVGSSRALMEKSGMASAVRNAGGTLHCFEEAGWGAFYEDSVEAVSHWKGTLMMPNILKQVRHIVLMPRCGRHVLAGSTLGMKAAVGYWRTDTRLEYHRDANTFQEKTAEGNFVETLLKKQRLVVTAADKVLVSFGPDKGHVFNPEIGLVIASNSVVAHDMVSLAWLLENREHVILSNTEVFIDSSQLVARLANHFVVTKLGGLRQAAVSDRLQKDELNSIWGDRTLYRAYEILGAIPQVLLESASHKTMAELVPKSMLERLQKMVTPMTA
jgi:uncharacterized protein (DUF362 family)